MQSAPGNLATGSFKNNQKQRETDKPGKDSRSKSQTAAQNFLPALAGMLDEAENLERDHRQDARHQIQNDAAEKTEEKKSEDSTWRS